MFLELGLGAAVSAVTSLIACRLLIAAGLVDVPDVARKAHAKPTPTSGGLGIAFGFGAGLLAVNFFSTAAWRAQIGVEGFARLSIATVFACAFLALGFLDDARPLGPRMKFAVFAALAVGLVLAAGPVETLPLGGGETLALGFGLGLLGSALFVFTLVNCVNFMDGANGLAMGSVAIGLLALAAIALLGGAPGVGAMALCGAAALAGFLVWNFPNGRLFAGDSGALFAGALAALTSLLAVHRAELSALLAPVIFFPLLADVLLTLAWRVQQKRRILNGHAEHLYQIGIRCGLSHARVTLIYWAAMAACGGLALGAAWLDASGLVWGSYAPLAALAAAALIWLGISAAVRRFARLRGMGEV